MNGEMRKIESGPEADAMIKAAYKDRGRVYTNCFMFADKLHRYAEDGRLSAMEVPDGLLLFLDMDEYDILYYYICPDRGLTFEKREKPVVIEFFEFENRKNKQNDIMVPYFESAGFYKHNLIRRLAAEYDQEKIETLLARPVDEREVITARPEHADEIIEMVFGAFDPLKNLMPSKSDVRESIKNGEYLCILSDAGKVVCTMQAVYEKASYYMLYVVTDPEWRFKNLSFIIRKAAILKAWELGLKKRYGWWLDGNEPGLIAARKTGLDFDGASMLHYIK